jgi:hypothetical protein
MRRVSCRNGELLNDLEISPLKGLHSLVKYELGFGGKIVSLADCYLKVHTRIFSHLDSTEFYFSVEEWAKANEALRFWVDSLISAEQVYEDSKKVLGDLAGNPLMLTMSSGLIAGGAMAVGENLKRYICMLSLCWAPYIGEKDAVILSLWEKNTSPEINPWGTDLKDKAFEEVLRVLPGMSLRDAMECTGYLEIYNLLNEKINVHTSL